MLNNDCCTVYRQVYDARARSDRYERYFIPMVCWQDMRYGLSDKGMRDNGRQSGAFSTVYFPLAGFTPELGDLFVRGDCSISAETATQKNVLDSAPSFVATQIERCEYGCTALSHWEVSG